MFEKLVKSCKFLLNNFPESQDCQEYLSSRVNRESQELFEFGFFPNANSIQALIYLVGEDYLKQNKFLYNKEIEDSMGPRKICVPYFEYHPLILPVKDAYGNVAGLIARSLLSKEEMAEKEIDKYKYSHDFKKGNYVFGLYENKQAILDSGFVYIVEGQFDAIKATEKGLKNVVAIGTSFMSPYQFSVINRYTNNIFLLLDNDAAGEKGRAHTIDKFGKYANIVNFYLPHNYKDIDEYLTHNEYDSLSLLTNC